MTLKQKREIVEKFLDGNSIAKICIGPVRRMGSTEHIDVIIEIPLGIEQILRDFMNGKFKLKPREPSE